jgi:hypothetical protein
MTNLSDIPKKNPFKTPNGYFDDFTRDLETKISEERIAEKCGKKLPFSVPENYFSEFTEKITERTVLRKSSKRKIIPLLAPYAAAAAALIIIFSLWNGLLQNRLSDKNTAQNTEIKKPIQSDSEITGIDPVSSIIPPDADTAEVERAVGRVLDGMSIAEITELSESKTDTTQKIPADEYDKALEEYLMEHADYSDIIAEL